MYAQDKLRGALESEKHNIVLQVGATVCAHKGTGAVACCHELDSMRDFVGA